LRAAGRAATGRAVLTLSLRLALGLTGDCRRDAAKEALLVRLLAGRHLATLSAVAEAFAGEVVTSHLRPDTLARLEWHRTQGHHVVIVSASPELYVAPLGRCLGVDVLATRLEVGSDGRLTGRLAGRNCRGAEKALRLREHLGPEPVTLIAYGDSKGDRQLLAMAQTAVWVGRRALPRLQVEEVAEHPADGEEGLR
jgi:HAD superfamily hydrolase (TIGR01490 family)